MGRFDGPRWPTPRQTLLLRAALDEPAAALDAWEEWVRSEDLIDIDGADYAVLPAIYRNIQGANREIPEGERLRGIFRRAWYAGQVLTSQAAQAIAALEQAGIPTMLLKGAALMAIEPDLQSSVRHMGDVDVLIPDSQVDDAVEALTASGWTPEISLLALRASRHVLHGVGFTNGAAASLDLHWHVLEEACRPGADGPFWAMSRPATFQGIDTEVLSPQDMLLHACVHGTRGKPTRVIHWVIDAVHIIEREHDGLDWDSMVDRARELELTLALGESLRYLATEFSVSVPEQTIEALECSRHSRIERFDYRAKGAPPTVFWNIAADVNRYRRISSGLEPIRRLTGFFTYLQHLWVLDSPWHVPLEGARRIWGRLRESRFRVWRPLRWDHR